MLSEQDMTINQLMIEKKRLSRQVFEAVEAFQKKTGVGVRYVNLTSVDVHSLDEIAQQILTSVDIELSI